MAITLAIRKKVEVPETDITEAIAAIQQWFTQNPRRRVITAQIFGHTAYKVSKANLETDVRDAANNAKPYNKA